MVDGNVVGNDDDDDAGVIRIWKTCP